jgi:hypothetical protein
VVPSELPGHYLPREGVHHGREVHGAGVEPDPVFGFRLPDAATCGS